MILMMIGALVAGITAAVLPQESARRAAYLGTGLVGTVAAALMVGYVA